MISIKVMLNDLIVGKRSVNGNHLTRQDRRFYYRGKPYKKETNVLDNKYDSRQETSPYYSYNYHHGKSAQMREKFSKDRNEQFDRSRETNSNIYQRDYNHRSVSTKDDPISNKKSDSYANNGNNYYSYRRNYHQTSRWTCEQKNSNNRNSEQSELPRQENLFLQNNDARTRCFVERSQPKSKNGSILRPPVLETLQSTSQGNSLPQIREIITLTNPVLNGNDLESAATDEVSEERKDEREKMKRCEKRYLSRRELTRMRKRIAQLSLQPKSDSKITKPTASSAPKLRPITSTSSTQTPDQPPGQPLVFDEKVEESITDVYRCEKCHSLCLPELYECGAGHAVCEECWLCLSRCPGEHVNEHNAGGFRRALGLERLAKLLKFPCRWQNNGCQEKLGSDDWRDHATQCRHLLGKTPQEAKVQTTALVDSGLDSEGGIVVILDDDEEYEFQSGEE